MIITIVGPTGIGKTKLSLELAKEYNAEIINADSTQIYTEVDIATAKVKNKEMQGIKHHLLSIKKPNEEYSIYDYQVNGRKVIKNILSRGKTPIIVGGSGLYLSALLFNYKFTQDDNVNIFGSLSTDEMYEALMSLNKSLHIDKNNHKRLIRYYKKYINNSEEVESSGKELVYDTLIIGLTTQRKKLYEIINSRVDEMMENGLLDEAKNILSKYKNTKVVKTIIGYKEFIPYFNKEITLEKAIEDIKQNSRNLAKRQYTWFNNKMDVNWFEVNLNDFNKTINEVIEFINKSS